MTTPPGPHAMTAQAGAVAACPSCGAPCETEYDYNRKVNPTRIVAHRRYTPPAAVPVEALEGLVAKCLERELSLIDLAQEDEALIANEFRNDLIRLIKERSNG